MTPTKHASISAILLLLLGGCAGYQIGNYSLYPDHIRTVHVPVFESVSFRRNLGERLTEAVCKEIDRITPYKVFGRASAEVGAVMIVGGNIAHLTRVMTTSIALETRKGNLELALGLGIILMCLALVVNGAAGRDV